MPESHDTGYCVCEHHLEDHNDMIPFFGLGCDDPECPCNDFRPTYIIPLCGE